MAVNMNPTRSALDKPRAGSLLMRPSQVASVNDVEEPEDTLASVAAVAPNVASAPEVPVQPEPEVTDVAPAALPETPEVPPEVPQGTEIQGIPMAPESAKQDVLDSLVASGSPLPEGGLLQADATVDYDHPWFKEQAAKKKEREQLKYESILETVAANEKDMTAEDIKKAVEGDQVDVVEFTAEQEYEAFDNRVQRSLRGIIETPRYLAAIPGLTSRVIEKTAQDSDSRIIKAAGAVYSAVTSTVIDAMISKFSAGSMDVDAAKVYKGLYEKGVVDPVVQGKTLDQKFENDLLRKIKDRTGETLGEEYLQGRAYVEAGQEGAMTFGLLGLAKGVSKGVSESLAVSAGKTLADSGSLAGKEAVKGGTGAVASVWGANAAIDLIDPKSKEAEILAGIIGGGVTGTVVAGGMETSGKLAKYTPTGIAIRGSGVLLKKAASFVKEAKRDHAIGKIQRTEGTDHKEVIARYYARLDQDSPEVREMALRILNDTELSTEERLKATDSIIKIALEDPLSREAEVVRTSIAVMKRDENAIEGAWTQAELLNKAFDNEQFRADVFDVYNGVYTDSFMKLRETVSPQDILNKQGALLDFMKEQLRTNTELSTLERSELTAAATLVETNMNESIKGNLSNMQQELATALEFHTGLKFSSNGDLTESVTAVRDALNKVKAEAKGLIKVGYASIDPQNKVRSSTAMLQINDTLASLPVNLGSHKDIQRAFNSLLADSTARHRDTSTDTSIIAGTKVNPTTLFTKGALTKADQIVYLNPEQFQQLTGVKLKQGKLEKPLSTVAKLELESDADGSYVVKGAKGSENYGPLGKDTLIPVSMDGALLRSLVDSRLRIKDPSGAVVSLDVSRQLGKTGDDRHNIALLDQTIEEARKKGNLSNETTQASFVPKFDVSKLELTYHEMDQFQRSIRRLRKEAYNREDGVSYQALGDLNNLLNDMIQESLADNPKAYEQRRAMDKLYGDAFIPELEDYSSLVGKATTRKPNRTYSYAMSNIIESIGGTVEMRQQLRDVLNPENSKFIKGITNTKASAQLDKLMNLDKARLNALEKQGMNVASALLDIKMTDIVDNMLKNIGTDVDPRDFLATQLKSLQDDPDFAVLYEASRGTVTNAMLTKALQLPDDADVNIVLDGFQRQMDVFDGLFYKSVKGMKDPSNTAAILDTVSSSAKLDELEIQLLTHGELSVVAPHMIKVVLSDILRMGEDGFSVATINNGIRKYGDGLKRLPGGNDVLQVLNTFKDNQNMLNRLNGSAGKARLHMGVDHTTTNTERRLSFLPSVFSDIKSARKGIIGMDYAIFSSITGIAIKEMKALRKIEGKASSEVFAAALMNKGIFDKLQSISPALNADASVPDRLRNISLVVHAANGSRLGAMEAVANLIDSSHDSEALLEALRATPEYAEVEQEEELMKAIPELLKRPEENPEVTYETMKTQSAEDPLHEVTNHEGPITDGMTTDDATKTNALFKFQDLKSQGVTKEQVLKPLKP